MLWVAVLFFKHRKQNNYAVSGEETLVVYASQTGTAEKIARAKAAALSQQEQTSVVSMASLKLNTLSSVSKVIFRQCFSDIVFEGQNSASYTLQNHPLAAFTNTFCNV